MDQWLTDLIAHLPSGNIYLCFIFIIALLESLPAIGLLIPGSTLIVAAGFLVSHQHGSLINIMISSLVGAYIGDLLSFELGRKYGSTLLKIQLLQRNRPMIRQAEIFFMNHGGKSLFFARFLGPIRGITPFIAGLSEMPRKNFNVYAPISAILWGISYPGIGFIGGASWQKAEGLAYKFGLSILVALIVTIAHYAIKNKLGEKK